MYDKLAVQVIIDCQKTPAGKDGLSWCNDGDDLLTLQKKLLQINKCGLARANLMYACFRGGDLRHLRAHRFVLRKKAKCEALINGITLPIGGP
jgi:hypothetical protein